jgi:hypothetical protein
LAQGGFKSTLSCVFASEDSNWLTITYKGVLDVLHEMETHLYRIEIKFRSFMTDAVLYGMLVDGDFRAPSKSSNETHPVL